jgi:hypothetical protein
MKRQRHKSDAFLRRRWRVVSIERGGIPIGTWGGSLLMTQGRRHLYTCTTRTGKVFVKLITYLEPS